MPYFLLLVLCAFYCHRFYGIAWIPEGDVVTNTVFRGRFDLFLSDYNPYQWQYLTHWVPHWGLYNPVIVIAMLLVSVIGASWTLVTQATVANMISSGILLWLLSCSVFYSFRKFSFSAAASFLAAIIISFTGFHLIAVREFDHFYLASFIPVCPLIWFTFKLYEGQNRLRWASLSAMAVSISLLGGTNVPMFLYLPFYFLFPFLAPKDSPARQFWKTNLLWQFGAVAAGILASAAIVAPGMAYLGETGRAQLEFFGLKFNLRRYERLYVLLFRDWWRESHGHFHEWDCFFGWPIVLLAGWGAFCWRKLRAARPWQHTVLFRFCLGVLVWTYFLSDYSLLPKFMMQGFEFFYGILSIRFPNRFGLLMSLPIAFLAARGWDSLANGGHRKYFLFGSVAVLALFFFLFLPRWPTITPEVQKAVLLSLGSAGVAVLLLVFYKEKKILSGCALLSIFFMYLYGSTQGSLYHRKGKHTWIETLGLSSNYSHIFQQMRDTFESVPSEVSEVKPGSGRIFNEQRTPVHASFTEHEYVFTRGKDPALPVRLIDLYSNRTPSILDMYGVCWHISQEGRLNARPHCLPKYWVVGDVQRVPTPADALDWVTQRNTETFKKKSVVACDEVDCASLRSSAQEAQERLSEVRLENESPDHLEFTLSPGGGYLLLSIPYRFDWKAELNGVSVPVLRANYAFMAVPIPETGGKLTLRLSHRVLYTSGILTLAIWGLLLSFVFTPNFYRANNKNT